MARYVTWVAIGVLFAVTSSLAAWYHDERETRARAHLEAGRDHVAAGRLDQAVGEFRAALLLERGEPEAEEALALTLLQLGRYDEAESYLTGLLDRDPTSGRLNLALARIFAARADGDARRLYQRAIFGEWDESESPQRLTARFELADYLRRSSSREELLASLLQLRANVPAGDTASERRLATLFVDAGAPGQAIAVLRAASASAPDDVDLLSQLADVEADAGQPAEARATLRRALALAPARGDLQTRLEVIDRVLALHPGLPNLRLTTRTRRSRDLLAAVVAQTAMCDEMSGEVSDSRRDAQARLGRRAVQTAETAEADQAAAVQLWTAAADCRSAGIEAAAISRIIDDLRRAAETEA